jgi:hypothetical protein
VNLWYLVEEERFELEFLQFVNRIQIRSTDAQPYDFSHDVYISHAPVNV